MECCARVSSCYLGERGRVTTLMRLRGRFTMSLIKPIINTDTAVELTKKLFRFSKIHKVKELISFCDRNFYIKGSRNEQNRDDEFVLKILNSVDSQEKEQLEAEVKASEFLREKGFPCPEIFVVEGTSEKMALVQLPRPVPNSRVIDNNMNLNQAELEQDGCIVRLISFLAGDIVDSLERSPELLISVGKLVGTLSLEFKDFSHPGLKSRSQQHFRWDILELFNLEKCIVCLEDEDQVKLFRQVHDTFTSKVKPKLDDLRRGAIHNDLNGENLLVSKPPYSVTGVIDFGDIVESVLVSELSNAMAFFMKGDLGIEFSGCLLAGYQSVFPLPVLERDLLYYFVAARLAQLALYSQCSVIDQPNEENLQACLNKYMSILRSFWRHSKDEVETIWRTCEENFAFS